MKRSRLLLAICFTSSIAWSQENLKPFGTPDRLELEMKECAFDKNAGAMKLLDYQEKEVIAEYGLKIKTWRRVKIKIFNQKGFESANIIIPYISRIKGTKFTDISAYIYYLDSAGNIVTEKVSKKQIFRDKADDQVKKIKFTFPNVRPGCVIEYGYEKTEKNSLALEPWFFQDFIPTLYSKFILIMPSLINVDQRVIGVDSIEQSNRYEQSSSSGNFQRTYSLRNIPAFRPEPMMTSIADNLQRIEFAIQPSGFGFLNLSSFRKNRWEIFARVLNEVPLFGKQFNKPIPGTEPILDSVKKIPGRDEKIHYIFQQVKNQLKWDEQQTFYAGDIKEAWKERSGNSAEINLIILNLLRKSGITCSPILISTRNNGKIDENFFSLAQFNGVDVLVSDSNVNYILDGTRKYQSYKTPPDNILNRNVFNVDTSNIGWLYITDSRPLLKSSMAVNATLSDEGKLSGNALIAFYEHSKVQRMMDKNKTEEEKKEEEKEFLQKDFTELTIDSVIQENADNDLEPLTEKFNFSYQPSVSGKFLFLDPFFLSHFRKNPFTDSIRHSDIDFTSRQYLKTSVNITIADSYEVDHLPKNIRLRMADSSIIFERRTYLETNKILFVNTMEVLYPLFTKEDYSGVKEFFDRLYSMVTEQIILKRKD
jgi:hypothetical protein